MLLKQNQMINSQYMIIKPLYESKTFPSEVYLVQNVVDDVAYALKIILKKAAFEKDASEIFNREWKSLKELNHDNIVSCYDYGELDDFYYVLIDYVAQSQTLEKYILSNPNLSLLKKILAQIPFLQRLSALAIRS